MAVDVATAVVVAAVAVDVVVEAVGLAVTARRLVAAVAGRLLRPRSSFWYEKVAFGIGIAARAWRYWVEWPTVQHIAAVIRRRLRSSDHGRLGCIC